MVARRRNFSAQAVSYLRKLRDLTREIMRSLTKVGGRVAMVASGVGKAVLATYSNEDVSAIIHHHGMPRLTEKSIVRPGDLFKELEKIRRQGFAIDDEEACMVCVIAAVVYNDCAEPLAAISVSGVTSRLTDQGLPQLGQTVREVAAEWTVALGGVMPAAKDGQVFLAKLQVSHDNGHGPDWHWRKADIRQTGDGCCQPRKFPTFCDTIATTCEAA